MAPMDARRRALLLGLLVLVPLTAGCNAKDWWDVQGAVNIRFAPHNPEESPEPGYRPALQDFRKLSIAIHSISFKQQGELNPKVFSFGDSPLVVDMVEAHQSGRELPLVETKAPLRAIEEVNLWISVLEAVDAQGRTLPACFPGEPAPSKPCVSTPKNGNYRHNERAFSTPRGGEVTFVYTLAVLYHTESDEYVIYRDPETAVIRTS